MFRYFCGPLHDMSDLVERDVACSLCGQPGRCFRLEHALCPSIALDAKETGVGCFDCLRQGRFEFWHDTDIGLLDENGLTHVYNHNQSPPPDFPASALVELRRTPQIVTCQQELWLTHCNDFMAYIGTWDREDFYAHAPGGDARALFHDMTDEDYRHLWDESLPPAAERLESWHATFYAFRCLNCGKLRGNRPFTMSNHRESTMMNP
ncbi:MAG: CbrC family protein [Gemmataceae bacterium]